MRKALIALGLVIAVLVGVDVGVRVLAQHFVGRTLARSLDVTERPSVSIGGVPFLPRVIAGSLPSATVVAHMVSSNGVTVQTVSLTLSHVTFPRDLLFGGGGTVRARSGEGTAIITPDELTEALHAHGAPVTVRFRRGRMLVSANGLPGEVEVTPSLSGRTLTLRPTGSPLPFALAFDLPGFVSGLRYTDLVVGRAAATVSFRLTEPAFRVPGS
jgi:DUF2993 family protein